VVEIESALKEPSHVEALTKALQVFNQRFCDAVVAGGEFTLSLEAHGDGGGLLHCQVHGREFYRPKGQAKANLERDARPGRGRPR